MLKLIVFMIQIYQELSFIFNIKIYLQKCKRIIIKKLLINIRIEIWIKHSKLNNCWGFHFKVNSLS